MRAFLVNLVQFSIGILIFNFAIYLISDRIYYEPYRRYDTGYSVYLFADSHGLGLADFGEANGIYNSSIGSDSYRDIRRKLQFVLHNEKNVDLVFLSVDDHMLGQYREVRNNSARSVQYASSDEFTSIYEYIQARYIKIYSRIFQPSIRDLISETLRSYVFKLITKPDPNASTGTQWKNYPIDERKRRSLNRSRVQFPDTNPKDAQSKALLSELEAIVQLCEEYDVKLVGVKFPLSDEYLDIVGSLSYGADEFARKRRIPVLDLSNSFIGRPELFLNQDHINEAGGELVCEVLVDYAKKVREKGFGDESQ